MNDHQLVLVEWVDSRQWYGWHGAGEELDALIQSAQEMYCTSLGIVVREDGDRVVLAQSVSHAGFAQGILAIPRGAIRSIRQVEPINIGIEAFRHIRLVEPIQEGGE